MFFGERVLKRRELNLHFWSSMDRLVRALAAQSGGAAGGLFWGAVEGGLEEGGCGGGGVLRSPMNKVK